MLLVKGKSRIAIALRILLTDENYPCVIHCTHGKDRTGVIIMLMLLLCSVPTEVQPLHHHAFHADISTRFISTISNLVKQPYHRSSLGSRVSKQLHSKDQTKSASASCKFSTTLGSCPVLQGCPPEEMQCWLQT